MMPLSQPKTPERRAQLLESLLEAGIWSYDVNTRDIYWSKGLYRLLGLDPHAVVASRELYDSLVHPEDRLSHQDIMQRANAVDTSPRRFRIIRPDGHLVWLESRTEYQYDRNGKLTALHGVVQEVTKDQKLKEEHHQLGLMAASMRKIIGGDFWRAEPDGTLIDVAQWSRLTGEAPERLRDPHALVAIHPEDRPIVTRAREDGIRTRQRVTFTARVKRGDGDYQAIEHVVLPVLAEDGSVVEWHGMSWPARTGVKAPTPAAPLAAGHIRAARALLQLTARELAEAADVSFSTLRRMEDAIDDVRPDSVLRVRKALERHGIAFATSHTGAVSLSLEKS